MRRTGVPVTRHRSLFAALLVVFLLTTVATPTSPFHPPGHADTDGVAALAQHPLPHCAPSTPIPPADLPEPGADRLVLAALGTPAARESCPVLSRPAFSAGARSPPSR